MITPTSRRSNARPVNGGRASDVKHEQLLGFEKILVTDVGSGEVSRRNCGPPGKSATVRVNERAIRPSLILRR